MFVSPKSASVLFAEWVFNSKERFLSKSALDGTLALNTNVSSSLNAFFLVAADSDTTLSDAYRARFNTLISDLNSFLQSTSRESYIMPANVQALWLDMMRQGTIFTGNLGSQSLTTAAAGAITDVLEAVANGITGMQSYYQTLVNNSITELNAININTGQDLIGSSV